MPPAPTLAINHLFSGSVQVVRLLAGTSVVSVGDTLPGAILENFVDNAQYPINRVIQFGDTLYAVHGDEIFQYDQVAETWAVVNTLTNSNAGNSQKTGLHIAFDDVLDKEVLFAVWIGNVAPFQVHIATTVSGESGSWTNTQILAHGAATMSKNIMFRNELFVSIDDGPNEMMRVDPIALTATIDNTFSAEAGNGQSHDLCIFEGNLYLIELANNADPRLYRFSGGNFTFVQALTVTQNSNTNQKNNGGSALFTDGTSMFALVSVQNGSSILHWNLIQLDTNGSVFDETDKTVNLPDGWKDGGNRTGSAAGVQVFTDNETDPLNPTIHIFWQNNDASGAFRRYYEWPGVGNNWPLEQTTVGTNYALGNPKMGGGERFWTAADLNIKKSNNEISITGGQRLAFIASGDSVVLSHSGITGSIAVGDTVTGQTSFATGEVTFINSTTIKLGGVVGTFESGEEIAETPSTNFVNSTSGPSGGAADKTVRIYVNVSEEIPTLLATLKGTATGGTALRVDDTVIQVIADGVTEYTVEVNLVAMGILAGERLHWQYEVSP